MNFKIVFKQTLNRFRFYFSFLLLGFYLVIGVLFLFTDTWVDLLPKGRIIIGTILIAFGFLRFYVAYRRYVHKMTRIKSLKDELKENALSK